MNLGTYIVSCFTTVVIPGQLLNVLVKESQTEKMFLDKVCYFAANDWRKRVFEVSQVFSTFNFSRDCYRWHITRP